MPERPDDIDADAVDPDVVVQPRPSPRPRTSPEDVVDPDVDVRDPRERRDVGRRELRIIAAVAVGGVAGAEARYGIARAIPHDAGTWPWSTFVANVVGSLVIGVLIIIVERRQPHYLVRPLLATGVLGGFTTFSTFALDDQQLFLADRPFVAIGYSAASLATCLVATAVAVRMTRRLVPEGVA